MKQINQRCFTSQAVSKECVGNLFAYLGVYLSMSHPNGAQAKRLAAHGRWFGRHRSEVRQALRGGMRSLACAIAHPAILFAVSGSPIGGEKTNWPEGLHDAHTVCSRTASINRAAS